VDGRDDPAWLASWRDADAAVARRLDALLAAEEGTDAARGRRGREPRRTPGGLLVVGASSPIRDLDLMVAKYAVGDRRKVIANRGLSGIDGVVSTAIGAALGRAHGSRNLALMGDVTFLHDASGLVLGPHEPRPDLTIVVVNDDGGSIFAMLEQGDAAYADRFDTLFGTPHGRRPGQPLRGHPHPALKVQSLAELEHALANPNGGIEVVEVAGAPGQPAGPGRADPRAASPDRASAIKGAGPPRSQDGPMSSSADTFADFVDHLAEALDDARITEATGEEWAARLHFSRYHFDRMIRSVAGEPPSAFRRRLLLERAAYRMITTTAPLLDIAVEGGLRLARGVHACLHEGVRRPAGAWRRRPGHIQIRRRATCTSTHPAASGCPPETR
jgi:AraC-like DNA-binding protein